MSIFSLTNSESSAWGKITIPHKGKEYSFPYNLSSREVFNIDPPRLIRGKCLALVVLTPLVSVMRSVYYIAKTISMAVAAAFRHLDDQSVSKEDLNAISDVAYEGIRALHYGVPLTRCALEGVVFPYFGRMHYGVLERELNRHTDGPHRDKFYLAYCFQRLCIVPNDYPLNSEDTLDRLERYVSLVDSSRTAFCTGAFRQFLANVKLLRSGSY